MGVDEQLWEQKLMDYKVVSPSEYFGNSGLSVSNPVLLNSIIGPNGQLMPNHPLNHQISNEGGLNVLANGAVVAANSIPTSVQPAYPFITNNPNDNYGYLRNNRNTYYHPSQGYFEASSTAAPTAAANLPNASTNNSNNTVNSAKNNSNTSNNNTNYNTPNTNNTSDEKQNSKNRKYDGAGDSDELDGQLKQNPDDIIKLLYTNGDEEVLLPENKQQEQQISHSNNKGSSIPVEDEINSDLDDDDDDEDQDEDGDGYDESGTMDENVVLCQYEKVNRTRNKWRCVFKSGIIHVNGIDYVFTKANGEFEW